LLHVWRSEKRQQQNFRIEVSVGPSVDKEATVKRNVFVSGILPKLPYLPVFVVCKSPDSTNQNVNPSIFTFSRPVFDIVTQKK
jgi:hypothetical protein